MPLGMQPFSMHLDTNDILREDVYRPSANARASRSWPYSTRRRRNKTTTHLINASSPRSLILTVSLLWFNFGLLRDSESNGVLSLYKAQMSALAILSQPILSERRSVPLSRFQSHGLGTLPRSAGMICRLPN